MRSIGLACLMYLMVLGSTQEAAAASDAETIRSFGMVGRVAISCAGSPDANNPNMIYAISGAGAVTRTLRMDPSLDGAFVMQNLRLVGPDVLEYDEAGGASAFTISVLKQPDGTFRAWRSVRTSGPKKGEVLIENGKFKGALLRKPLCFATTEKTGLRKIFKLSTSLPRSCHGRCALNLVMHKTNRRVLAAFVCALAGLSATPIAAQEVRAVAGTYCLTGVMEVGSCIKLTFDGKFQYFLAYGAYDEDAEGTWRIEGGQVVLDSPAYDRRPTFAFKRKQRSESDAFDVIVESKAGRPMQGIDVSVTCDGRTAQAGVTGAEGFKIDCRAAPTQVLLGLGMYGVALQTIDVSGQAGPDKAYVFGFDPGDLGKKRFASLRFALEVGTSLTAVYADTPIRELAGRTFRYARQQ